VVYQNLARDFVTLVAIKEQQYRQNHILLIFLPRAFTRSYDISPFQGSKY